MDGLIIKKEWLDLILVHIMNTQRVPSYGLKMWRNLSTRNRKEHFMKGNEYQKLAARTINQDLTQVGQEHHALHGLSGEVGELHSIYQKVYQGHKFDEEHAKKELGDLLWFIAEYCTAKGWSLEDVMELNIEKLRARFPDGFEADKSLNRVEGDI